MVQGRLPRLNNNSKHSIRNIPTRHIYTWPESQMFIMDYFTSRRQSQDRPDVGPAHINMLFRRPISRHSRQHPSHSCTRY